MLSYNNDENLKKLMVLEMKKHQEKDQFIKGTYGKEENGEFKGCAVGCAIDSINIILGKKFSTSNHNIFEESIGIPEWIANLQDTLFEGLPSGENSQFAVDLLEAIPIGLNLEPVKWKFCAFIMKECIKNVTGLSNLQEDLKEQVLQAIKGSLSINEAAIENGKWDEAAAEAAWAAAEAAWAAARAAAGAARAAAGAAENNCYKIYAAELIRLLKEQI